MFFLARNFFSSSPTHSVCEFMCLCVLVDGEGGQCLCYVSLFIGVQYSIIMATSKRNHLSLLAFLFFFFSFIVVFHRTVRFFSFCSGRKKIIDYSAICVFGRKKWMACHPNWRNRVREREGEQFLWIFNDSARILFSTKDTYCTRITAWIWSGNWGHAHGILHRSNVIY